MECLICETEATLDGAREPRAFDCPRCGTYLVAGDDGWTKLATVTTDVGSASGWIREQNSLGITPCFTAINVQSLQTRQKPPFRERAEKHLLAAAVKHSKLSEDFKAFSPDLAAASYSYERNELIVIVDYLVDEGYLRYTREQQGYKRDPQVEITAAGRIAADELRTRRAKSSQGFVAMWFTPDMSPIYDEGFSVGIERAGYKSMRVDKKEHANKIDDEIIAEIRRSAFLVADFTGHRGGVYFEAGFAMGLGLPVIWTCRKDHMKDLHFDIRQYNCIDWSEADELATRIQQRIEAMLGRGPMIEFQQVA